MSVEDLHALLLQAPLSQLNSVLADLRGLLSASSSTGSSPRLAQEFEASLPALLRRFHEEQGKVVRLPGLEEGSIISADGVEKHRQSAYTKEPSEKSAPDHAYRNESQAKQFVYDHKNEKTLSADSYTLPSQGRDELRSHLDAALRLYLRDHYPDLDPQRTNEGACGAVWRKPLRQVKLIKTESQETVQEEAMEDALTDQAEAEAAAEAVQKGESTDVGKADPSAQDQDSAAAATDDAKEHLPGAPPAVKASIGDTAPHEASRADALDMQNTDDDGELVEEDDGQSEASQYVIQIVSGKSNAGNYWSGRLLSRYVYTPKEGSIEAATKLQIHYYEDGNVQLNTDHSATLSVTPDGDAKARAKAAIAAIRKHESDYHSELGDTFAKLNEKAIKGLRRQLPVTRQRVDWDKVLNYKLGSDLAGAQPQAGAAQ